MNSVTTRFADALAATRPIVLDGGLATELEAQGFDIDGHLWSASMLHKNPQAIVAAHRAYLDAGADCIISASYQASRAGFSAIGLSGEAADKLIAGSVDLARQARDEFLQSQSADHRPPLVAASVGPYGAVLGDGSEYRGNYGIARRHLRNFHAGRLALLDSSRADLLACETIPDIEEAEVLCELLRKMRTPSWVSFSCRDGKHISDGTPLREACALFADSPNILAVGINCTAPGLIGSLIDEARQGAPGKAVVVYPNSGEAYDASDNRWSGTSHTAEFGFRTNEWIEAGARIVGGCCRIGPAQIALIRQSIDKPGATPA